MTKRDFELIAQILKNPPIDNQHRREMAAEIAGTLAARYPSFDSEKFLAACGVL